MVPMAPKSAPMLSQGIAVVVLDALTRRQGQWVREEDLAKDLKLQPKQLRCTLRFLEDEKLVTRHSKKERADDQQRKRMHTLSYCRLDYAQICNAVRDRLHGMKKKLKDELEYKSTVQEYICYKCRKRYTALDALLLVSPYDDECFNCESCNGELVADGDDNARRRLKDMLEKMDEQFKPLMEQLNIVKDLTIPEFGETTIEVAFPGFEERGEDDVKSEIANSPVKVFPPWLIKQGMNLTKEQLGARGGGQAGVKMEGKSAPAQLSDGKTKSTVTLTLWVHPL